MKIEIIRKVMEEAFKYVQILIKQSRNTWRIERKNINKDKSEK